MRVGPLLLNAADYVVAFTGAGISTEDIRENLPRSPMQLTEEEAVRIARAYLDTSWSDVAEVFTVIEYEECISVSFTNPVLLGHCPSPLVRVEVDKVTKVAKLPWLDDEAEESDGSDE